MAAALLLAAVVAVAVIAWVLRPPSDPRRPPCIGSRVPCLGAALRLAAAPLDFIERTRAEHGPVFTVCALGKRFTFVTEDEGAEVFFTSKDLNFEQAVQRVVENAVSVPAEAFYQNHGRLYSMMKGKMGPSNVHLFTGTLCKELHEHMAHLGNAGTGDLMELVRNWSKSKKWLLKLFEKVVSDAERTNPSETTSKTLLQHLLDNLQGKHLAPNYGLLMLWASQANAVPIAFWTLVFILSYPTVYKKVMEDLASVFGSAGKDDIEVSEEDLKNLPYVRWCTLEAIRLRSPGAITKKVIKPIRIQSFTIPAGDMLMLSPYWLHRNPKYFPDPEMFKPDRWKEANLEKNAFLDGFVAFGGGKHQCPGRWFAIMEIQLFVVLFLYKYQFVLLDAVPKESPLHLVGTQQPLTPCRVQYKGWE
ncbi:24-hydroxycholesterol 7-alpha-hydroxylase isoform X6 [Lagopus muta]|uniref:24-hydroxycholesterol 7-alpha-hydroxylase isoform X6 n=1 Tax=Lagopus muta TaxID=64668 RepID=UPI00209CF700|nr:24-hydroxycholesterol 7-alpha-hydroxylase isoform X6 [Lagopus muta]